MDGWCPQRELNGFALLPFKGLFGPLVPSSLLTYETGPNLKWGPTLTLFYLFGLQGAKVERVFKVLQLSIIIECSRSFFLESQLS